MVFGISLDNPFTIILFLSVALFATGVMALWTLSRLRKSQEKLIRERNELREEVQKRNKQLNKTLEELRTTQLKLLEAGKISALASLSAGLLHQISQPITAINGFVKFLKKEMNPNEVFYKPVCFMDEQVTYLKQMLGDLMDLVRHREIKKDNIQVNDVIHRSVNLLKDELRIQWINWDIIPGENLPLVYADSVHLQQIFMNVITNAIQALSGLPKDKKRSIKIKTRYSAADKEVHISFEDSGPGISKEDQEHIFEPFFSTKTKGSGIGLALCQDLIGEHGGSISLESSTGQGTCFVIKLPCGPDAFKNL